jgi:hypothetical protein
MGLDDDANHQLKFSQLVQLQERFDEDPSIENYVSLRRICGGWDTEIHRFAGVDPLQALGNELERAGLARALVCGTLGGNDRDIDELCLQLMERTDRTQTVGDEWGNASARSRQWHFGRSCRSLDYCDDGSSSTGRPRTKGISRLAGSGTARRGEHRNLQEPHKMVGPESRGVFGNANQATWRETDNPPNSSNHGHSAKHREPLVSRWRLSRTGRAL